MEALMCQPHWNLHSYWHWYSGLGLGLELGLELGFTLVHNILLDGATREICALRMDDGELNSEGIESYELEG